jgi:acylglycerol lipase
MINLNKMPVSGYFVNADGVKHHTVSFIADYPLAAVIFIHGYTEHSGRYAWVAEQFNQAGISFYAYDQRGYGLSEGERAYVDGFQKYIEDFSQFLKNTDTGRLPVFIMGQSMGGLIGVSFLMQNPGSGVKGMISTSGALKVSEHISSFLRKISGVLSGWAPHLPTIKLEAKALSRDQNVVKEYLTDPLVYHGGAKSRTGHEMLSAMQHVQQNFSSFRHPVLLLHGTADRLADPEGSIMMYEKCASKDKSIRLFEGWYHELFREPHKDEIMQTIINWIKDRINVNLKTD